MFVSHEINGSVRGDGIERQLVRTTVEDVLVAEVELRQTVAIERS